MQVDFRYHLTSLAAVFFALFIGTLFGVAMKEGPTLHNQIQVLRREFADAQRLQTIDDRSNQFNERTQQHLIANRMVGRNVIIVQNASVFPTEKVGDVREALEIAGAVVTARVVLKPALLAVTPAHLTSIYGKLETGVPNHPGVGDLTHRLATDLGLTTTRIAHVLAQEKLISIEGDLTIPISTVVYLGGGATVMDDPAANNSIRAVDLPFLRGCEERQFRLAAAECFLEPRSAIPSYRKVARITVDNVDRAAGRIALIIALSTNQPGDFGYKKTAEDVIPDLE